MSQKYKNLWNRIGKTARYIEHNQRHNLYLETDPLARVQYEEFLEQIFTVSRHVERYTVLASQDALSQLLQCTYVHPIKKLHIQSRKACNDAALFTNMNIRASYEDTNLQVLPIERQRATDKRVQDDTNTPYVYFGPIVLLTCTSQRLINTTCTRTNSDVYEQQYTYHDSENRISPWNSSGAAYGGLPQNVSSLLPIVNSLLKPKSAILIFISASKSRFSAWRQTHKINPLKRPKVIKTKLTSPMSTVLT